jgi:hypothetical protein
VNDAKGHVDFQATSERHSEPKFLTCSLQKPDFLSRSVKMTSQEAYRPGERIQILCGDHAGVEGYVVYLILRDPNTPKVCLVTDDGKSETVIVKIEHVRRCDERTT